MALTAHAFGESEARRIALATELVLGTGGKELVRSQDVSQSASMIMVEVSTSVDADNTEPFTCQQVRLVNGDWTQVREVTARTNGQPILASEASPVRIPATPLGNTGYLIQPEAPRGWFRLTETMGAAPNFNTPSVTIGQRQKIDAEGEFGDDDDFALVPITNHQVGFTAQVEDYLLCMLVDGEWIPLSGVGGGTGDNDCCRCVNAADMTDPDGAATRTILSIPLDPVVVELPDTFEPGGTVSITAGIYPVTWSGDDVAWISKEDLRWSPGAPADALNEAVTHEDPDGNEIDAADRVWASLRFRKNVGDWMFLELMLDDTVVATWSNHSRHWQRLCSNELKADTKPNFTVTSGCKVCVTPGGPPTTNCSEQLYGVGNPPPIMSVTPSMTPLPADQVPYFEYWNDDWYLMAEAIGNNPGFGRLSLDGRCNGSATARGSAGDLTWRTPVPDFPGQVPEPGYWQGRYASWTIQMTVQNQPVSHTSWGTPQISLVITGELGDQFESSVIKLFSVRTTWQSSRTAPYDLMVPGSGPVEMTMTSSEVGIHRFGLGRPPSDYEIGSWFNINPIIDGEMTGF